MRKEWKVKEVGELLERALAIAGSHERLAEIADVSRQAVSGWFRRRGSLRTETWLRINQWLEAAGQRTGATLASSLDTSGFSDRNRKEMRK